MPTIEVKSEASGAAALAVRYRERGRGRRSRRRPGLLLVHGAGASSLCFGELLNHLGQRRWVVALDLPGHGGSAPLPPTATDGLLDAYRDVTAALAERLGLGRFVLVGHSLGGAVAQRFAAAHGDRLAGLVLLASGARLQLGQQLRELLERRPDRLAPFIAAHGFSPATAPADAERWAALALEAPPAVVRADFAACHRFDDRATVGTLSLAGRPLIVGGADDQITPPEMARALAALIPRARLELLSRAGHWLPLERPDATAELILDATS